jgi:hypothetical protein
MPTAVADGLAEVAVGEQGIRRDHLAGAHPLRDQPPAGLVRVGLVGAAGPGPRRQRQAGCVRDQGQQRNGRRQAVGATAQRLAVQGGRVPRRRGRGRGGAHRRLVNGSHGAAPDGFGPARQGGLAGGGVPAPDDLAQAMPLGGPPGEAQPMPPVPVVVVRERGDGGVAPGAAEEGAADQAADGGQGRLPAQATARVGDFGEVGQQTARSERGHGKPSGGCKPHPRGLPYTTSFELSPAL